MVQYIHSIMSSNELLHSKLVMSIKRMQKSSALICQTKYKVKLMYCKPSFRQLKPYLHIVKTPNKSVLFHTLIETQFSFNITLHKDVYRNYIQHTPLCTTETIVDKHSNFNNWEINIPISEVCSFVVPAIIAPYDCWGLYSQKTKQVIVLQRMCCKVCKQ